MGFCNGKTCWTTPGLTVHTPPPPPPPENFLYSRMNTLFHFVVTVMILSFRTDRSDQTVQTQIRQLLEEGLHCLLFHLHHYDKMTKYPKDFNGTLPSYCVNFIKKISTKNPNFIMSNKVNHMFNFHTLSNCVSCISQYTSNASSSDETNYINDFLLRNILLNSWKGVWCNCWTSFTEEIRCIFVDIWW